MFPDCNSVRGGDAKLANAPESRFADNPYLIQTRVSFGRAGTYGFGDAVP